MKRTTKQKVLQVYPDAISHAWAGPEWCIYTQPQNGYSLNLTNQTASKAWAEAWARISADLNHDSGLRYPGVFDSRKRLAAAR